MNHIMRLIRFDALNHSVQVEQRGRGQSSNWPFTIDLDTSLRTWIAASCAAIVEGSVLLFLLQRRSSKSAFSWFSMLSCTVERRRERSPLSPCSPAARRLVIRHFAAAVGGFAIPEWMRGAVACNLSRQTRATMRGECKRRLP